MDSYTKKIKKEEIPKEKDIERSNITQNNQSQNSKTEDLMFIQRAPENEKKKEIKENLNKFTQHFKELSKNDDKKFKNNITLNLNILTPDNFIKVKDILLDLVKGNKVKKIKSF